MEKSGSASEVSLLVRAKAGLFHMASQEKNLEAGCLRRFEKDCSDSDLSDCGTYVIGTTSTGLVRVWDFNGKVHFEEQFKDVSNVSFSRRSAFVVVTHGTGKETKVRVVRLAGREVGFDEQENFDIDIGFMKSGKRYTFFVNEDNTMVVQTAPNRLRVFDVAAGWTARGEIEIVPSTEIGLLLHGPSPLVFATNSSIEKDGKKGVQFEIYDLDLLKLHHSHFFVNLQQLDFFPSPKSNLLVIRGHKLVDDSGLSYYGKNTLSLMNVEKKTILNVPFYNGQLYNIAWNPRGDSFALVSGAMPAHTVIYSAAGEPQLVVERSYKNSVFWSPNGDFLTIAGFGNLNGEISVWNVPKKSRLGKCMHGDAGDLEWAPDGRHFVTKVEFRFLREYNQYRVYDYHGTLINKVELNATQLHSVRWYPKGVLVDRPPSPARVPSQAPGVKSTNLTDIPSACFAITAEDIKKANSTNDRSDLVKAKLPDAEKPQRIPGQHTPEIKKKKKKKK